MLADLIKEVGQVANLEPNVIPLIDYATNPMNEESLYLARYGYKLWLALIEKSSELTKPLTHLFPRLWLCISDQESMIFGIRILGVYIQQLDQPILLVTILSCIKFFCNVSF